MRKCTESKSHVNYFYFLSSASRIPIVLSRARSVDSLILWDIAQSLIDIRMPLYSTPQFPQDDVWPLCRWSKRTSTSFPHKHSHRNLRLPINATSLTTVNSPYFFPLAMTIGRNLLSLRLGFWGTFFRRGGCFLATPTAVRFLAFHWLVSFPTSILVHQHPFLRKITLQ